MVAVRINAVIVGAFVMAALVYWAHAPWYVSAPLGLVAYLAARQIGTTFIADRQSDKARRNDS